MMQPDAGHPPAASHRQPMGLASVSQALFISALWGGTPVAISYSIDALPPVAVAAVRFAMAAVFMLFWCRLEGSPLRLGAGQLFPCVVTAAFLFVQIATFNVGVAWSNSSHATLFINTFIFWVAGIEHFVTRTDRLTPRKLAGLVIAAAGVVLILAVTDQAPASAAENPRDQPTLAGDLLLAGSGLLLAMKIIYTKHAIRTIEPGKLIFWHDVIGVLLFVAWSGLFELEELATARIDAPAVWGLLYQGVVVAGFCFAVHARLLRKHSASTVSVYSFATPLFGIALAVMFRGDSLSEWLLVSGACVATGILLVTARTRDGS